MRVVAVRNSGKVYTCNVYLVLGEWKRIEDINTLVDVGNDPAIVEVLQNTNMGLGKNRVEQVVLTHSHSDHTGILPQIIREFRPKVFAYSPFMEGVTQVLRHGDTIRMGSKIFEVIHTPGHSSDSICLFSEETGALFAGDTPLVIRTPDAGYEEDYIEALESLCRRDIRVIYFGHGDPLTENVGAVLRASLNNVKAGTARHPRPRAAGA